MSPDEASLEAGLFDVEAEIVTLRWDDGDGVATAGGFGLTGRFVLEVVLGVTVRILTWVTGRLDIGDGTIFVDCGGV